MKWGRFEGAGGCGEGEEMKGEQRVGWRKGKVGKMVGGEIFERP